MWGGLSQCAILAISNIVLNVRSDYLAMKKEVENDRLMILLSSLNSYSEPCSRLGTKPGCNRYDIENIGPMVPTAGFGREL
jgi:hypothetical protein